jgi:hypothetical protein
VSGASTDRISDYAKAAVVTLLEADCTAAGVQAIADRSMQMVEHYAKQLNQKRLAA